MTDPVQLVTTQEPVQPKASSPVLAGHWPTSDDEARETQKEIDSLSEPASPIWIAATTVSHLTAHYFVSALPDPVAEQLGRDWINELGEYPQWAIENAFAWWISKDNSNRQKRPLPGDISERAHALMSSVRGAQCTLRLYEQHGDNPPVFLRK